MKRPEKYKIITSLLRNDSDSLYDKKTLFNLGLHTFHSVKSFLRMMFYNKTSNWSLTKGEKSSLTKRSKRIWNILEPITSKGNAYTGQGVYVVASGWRFGPSRLPICFIYSEDKKEAKDISKILFSYLCNENESLVVSFVYYGTVIDAISENEEVIMGYKEHLKKLAANLDRVQGEIEVSKVRVSALKTLLDQQKR